MNENITNRIIQYLQVNSNYAIILTGEYGIGKTHFLKTVVFPEVEKVSIKSDINTIDQNQKTYKTIHVSLFGIKSTEEIQKALFLEIYPILKSKVARISKGLIKGLGQVFSVDIDSLLKDSEIGSKQAGFENILICIDDIDRKDPDFKLSEIYGYVNDLVENHGAKVIMIANEDKLRDEENDKGKDSYSILREKVIGVTIAFKPDLSNAFDQIIKDNYKGSNNDYFEYLKSNKQEITRVIQQADNNLRNLLFFLEHFKIVFNIVRTFFEENQEVKVYSGKIYNQLLAFTLPLSIEYKIGKLDEQNTKIIKDLYYPNLPYNFNHLLFNANNAKTEKTYREVFIEKYFKDAKIDKNFFPSVFNYILGLDEFTKEKFSDDIFSFLKINNKTIPEGQKLIQDLGYWDFINLNEDEYRAKTNALIDYLMDGTIPLDQIGTVFHFATRFNNLLGYDLSNLKTQIVQSLDVNYSKFSEVPKIKINNRPPSDAEYREELMHIIDKCIQINSKIHEDNNKKSWLLKFEEFKANFENFLDESIIINSDTSLQPYFFYFPNQETIEFILSQNNKQIFAFANYVESRYKPHNISFLSKDKSFLYKLQNAVQEKHDSAKDNLEKIALNILIESIKKALKILPDQMDENFDD